ncbi:ribosome small subunit-dependent GTPase A [Tumebacillus permanentifrigoris]|nr:ribosome small subunit-dependent GTPase A [Tumebacillus permanentifrigoris]
MEHFAPYASNAEFTVARVALEHKHLYRVYSEHGDLLASVTGKMRHEALGREAYPAVGDWVVISARPEEGKATVHGILPRFSKFSRKVAGNTTEEQIVAANVNTVFLVMALNNDFNIRRLERYLVAAWESGANPVVILTKSDLCDDIEDKISDVESVAFGVPIHAISSELNQGLEQLQPYIGEGKTVALIGSSGVGKSTLVNRLCGEDRMMTKEVREGDDRGKHTTTYRELIRMPQGGLLIDTPGMRELQLWEADESSLSGSFADIDELASACFYRDCKHHNEPGCAVQRALESGTLEQARFQSYLKLQKELAYLERKSDVRAAAAQRDKWKQITKSMRGTTKKK